MAKKLRVTYQDGNWERDGKQPIAVAILPVNATMEQQDRGPLHFRSASTKTVPPRTLLIIPESRLIAVVQTEVPA